MARLICHDPRRLRRTRRSWHCNCDPTANIATRTFRPIQRKRVSAAMSARSARTVSRTSCTMSARTAAADLPPGRYGRRGNGGQAHALRSSCRRIDACICRTTSTISPHIRPASGIFRRKSGELYVVIARSVSDEAIPAFFAAGWIASWSLSSGPHSRDPLARNDGNHSAGTIVPSTSPKPTR